MGVLRFDGQVALVTGVSTFGLGLTYAQMLAERGCCVVINDLGRDWAGGVNEPGTAAAVEKVVAAGGKAVGVTGDVVFEGDRIVAEAVEAFGRLDMLINNAGAGGDFDTLVDVHLHGSRRMTEAAWPYLAQGGHGRVVNIASNATFGSPGMPGYGAAKGGILALTRTQAIIGADAGVRVNAVLPSAWTRSTANIAAPGFGEFMKSHFTPEAVGAFVVYLLSGDRGITGEAFAAAGGLVSRVVQAETQGALAADSEPESWRELVDQVMDAEDVIIPSSMWSELDSVVRRLGPDVYEEWSAIGIRPDVTGKVGD